MKTLLHVGCGPSSLHLPDHEEIRVDTDPTVEPDLLADFRQIPREPASADVIIAKHCLEHVPWPDVLPTLRHWATLLRPGGKVHIRVPDLETVAHGIMFRGLDAVAYESPMGPVTYRSMLYGHEPNVQTEPGMRHQTGFTAVTLRDALKAAGLEDVEVEIHAPLFELRAEGTKL